MKNLIYIAISLLFTTPLAKAQNTLSVSLNDAIQLGWQYRHDLKADSLNVLISNSSIQQTKKNLFPDLSLDGNVTYYNNIEQTFVPAGMLGNNQPEKVSLSAKNNTSFSLDANYTLYKPGLYTDIKIAKNDYALSKEKNIQKRIEIKQEIMQAYYEMMLKKIQYKIAKEEEGRYRSYFNLIKGKFKNGAVIENELKQAELDYTNAKLNTQKQKQNYELSCYNLKYSINIPEGKAVCFTDSIETVQNEKFNLKEGSSISERTEHKQLEIEQNGYRLQLTKAKENYLPTVSLSAGYSQHFKYKNFNYSNNFYWYPVDYVGIKVSIPIMQSVKNKESIRQNKYRIEQNEESIQQLTNDIQNERGTAIIKLNNADLNLQTTKKNYQLSEEVFNTQKQQYELGSFQYIDLLNTEKSIHDAQQNYVSAIYDLLIAKLNYEKAIGDL